MALPEGRIHPNPSRRAEFTHDLSLGQQFAAFYKRRRPLTKQNQTQKNRPTSNNKKMLPKAAPGVEGASVWDVLEHGVL